jgi:type VI secretion system secreted protein Hcp
VQYLTIKLKKAIISSVSPVVEGEGLPLETFSLKYAAVQWEYIQQTMDGKTAKGAPAMWSLATNKPVFEAPN